MKGAHLKRKLKYTEKAGVVAICCYIAVDTTRQYPKRRVSAHGIAIAKLLRQKNGDIQVESVDSKPRNFS